MFSHDLKLKTLSQFNASEDNTLSTANGVKFKFLQIDGRIRILVDILFYIKSGSDGLNIKNFLLCFN